MDDASGTDLAGRQGDVRELAALKAKLGRLLNAVEDGTSDSVTQDRISERRLQITALEQRLAQKPLPKPRAVLPTADELQAKLGDVVKRVREADAEALGWMRTLVRAFSIRPVQVPGCKTVVLQAVVNICLIALLDGDVQTFLRANHTSDAGLDRREVTTKHFEVLLTELPEYVRLSKEPNRRR
jgi:DNA-directed RNA polymerase subunit H (RpoH/RPB5)